MFLEYGDLKDAYAGKRLFVCGNAPSVAEAYPLLEHEVTFCCNWFSLWKDAPFEPSIYGLTEPMNWGWDDRKRMAEGVALKLCLSMKPPPDEEDDWVWLPKAQPGKREDMLQGAGLAHDAPFRTGANTPMNIGVQFAIYMGFTEIYLVGIELPQGHKNRNAVYGDVLQEQGFYKDVSVKPVYNVPFLVEGYDRCLSDIQQMGRKLVNCTPTGLFRQNTKVPFVSLEEVLCPT